MRLELHSIFPHIPKFKEINLNEWLHTNCAARPESPEAYQQQIDRLNKDYGVPTYGGWMEYREWMWSDSYMSHHKKYVHLGLDVYLPQKTPVRLPFDSTVIDVFYHEDDDVGWGGRITVQREKNKAAVVLGHLGMELPAKGSVIRANETLGHIATWPINGNVFEHLHIQIIRAELLPSMNWELLDGYGYYEQAEDFPNPLLADI